MAAFGRIAVSLGAAGIADLLAKRQILLFFSVGQYRTLVPHAVALTYVANRHGALGFFGDRAWLLVVLALVVLCAVAVLFRDSLRRSAAAQIGYGLVAGGALGNVVDRIVHGYVVDFIALAHLFVFNVADACISAGLALMALPALRSRGT